MDKIKEEDPPDIIDLANITLQALQKRSEGKRLNGEMPQVRQFASALERKFDPQSSKILDTREISRIKAMVESYIGADQTHVNFRELIAQVYQIGQLLRDIYRTRSSTSKTLLEPIKAFLDYQPELLSPQRSRMSAFN